MYRSYSSATTETMMNTLMCTKNWLGFQELTKEELDMERGFLMQFQELAVDGDIATEGRIDLFLYHVSKNSIATVELVY